MRRRLALAPADAVGRDQRGIDKPEARFRASSAPLGDSSLMRIVRNDLQ